MDSSDREAETITDATPRRPSGELVDRLVDYRIGRDVAVKRMKTDEPSRQQVERFLRDGWTIVAAGGPLLLEWLGVFPPTWWATPGGLLAKGNVFEVGTNGVYILVAANIGMLVMIANYTHNIARDRCIAHKQLFIQAWHLGHLLPKR